MSYSHNTHPHAMPVDSRRFSRVGTHWVLCYIPGSQVSIRPLLFFKPRLSSVPQFKIHVLPAVGLPSFPPHPTPRHVQEGQQEVAGTGDWVICFLEGSSRWDTRNLRNRTSENGFTEIW